MAREFIVRGRLAGLNDYTKACRSNAYAGAKLKRAEEERIREAIRAAGIGAMRTPIYLHIYWFDAPNKCHRHRDKDNIAFAKKFILDAMVAEGVIPDDSWESVDGFKDAFIDSDEDRVHVWITEVGNEE